MNTSTTPIAYPVHVDAELEPGLSRGLWLVKWILAIPHYVVLAFLWIAFAVTTVVAFFSILFTARYPRAIFDFNVGVMRWSWRVAFYAYGALGTDRYPPFTLAEVPDYPAHLEVDYPEHLSRGLVLVKWWLLAIPHYLVLALFVGGAGYALTGADDDPVLTISLLGILVLVAGVVLLFTGRYPQRVFDLILGINRWVLRVAGYVSLMTDRYPPFSLDQGPHDPDVATNPPPGIAPASTPAAGLPAAPPHRGGWTAGRVFCVVLGSLLVVGGLGLAGAGGTLALVEQTQRDDDGFLMSPSRTYATEGFAITSGDLQVHTDGASTWLPEDLLGDVRVAAESTIDSEVFVGIAPAADVAAYLGDVQHDTVLEVRDGETIYRSTQGGAPEAPPTDQTFWTAEAIGTEPALTWEVEDGDWTVVVMAADGSDPVAAEVRAGAEVPVLETVIAVLLVLAGLALVAGVLLIALPVRAASRGTTPGAPPGAPPAP